MKRNSTIIWVCPTSDFFYRSGGEIKSRLGTLLGKLTEKGINLHILIPFDAALLPKTKVSSARVIKKEINLAQPHAVEFIKLTRSPVNPSIHMVKLPELDEALKAAVFSKAALAFGLQLKTTIDIFHLFEWQTSLLPYFLESSYQKETAYRTTRCFLQIKSLAEQGNFAPAIMDHLGIPSTLFHPEGLEFYDQFSFLKAGILFADCIGIVEQKRPRPMKASLTAIRRFNGVLEWQSYKLRNWASDRAAKSYLDAYDELSIPFRVMPRLPALLEKLKKKSQFSKASMEMIWGPPVPEKYNQSKVALLTQAPKKAFAYWEWADSNVKEFGLVLEEIKNRQRVFLSRGLHSLGEFWIDVEPDREYVVELVGWTGDGKMHTLMRSNKIKTSRESASSNKNAIFINTKMKSIYRGPLQKFGMAASRANGGSSSHWVLSPDINSLSLQKLS